MNKKKILSLIMALVMLVGVFSPLSALAAGEKVSTDKNAKTKTVTLHKLMMEKDVLKAWDSNKVEKSKKADGTKDGYDATQTLDELKQITELKKILGEKDIKEADGVYFAWQREFEEEDPKSQTDPKAKIKVWRYIDKDGNKATVQNPEDANFKTAVLGGMTANKNGYKFTTENLPNGAYKIQEIKELSNYKSTDGKTIVDQKAVPVEITLPLVNEDGTVIDAHVYPKNTDDKPDIDKNFKKGHGLTETQKYDKDDKKVTVGKSMADPKNTETNINDGAQYVNKAEEKARATASVGDNVPYEVKTKINAGTSYENLTWNDIMTNGLTYNKDLKIEATNGVTFADTDYELIQDDNGFRLKMHKSGLEKIEKVTKGAEQKEVEITLTYSATINGTAKVDNPEKNNVTLEYGHKPGKDLKEKPVTPKNGELKVTKNFEGTAADGLRIVYSLKNDNGEVATVALDKTMTSGTINLGNGITFVIDSAFNGTFKGLPDGANYKITERVAGYNPEYADTNADGTVTITNKKDNDNPPPLEPTTPEVVVGGKKFVKTDSSDAKNRLAGAKFVVKNGAGKYLAVKSVDTVEAEKRKVTDAKAALDTAVEAYNKREDDTNKDTLAAAIKTAQDAYNEAFKTAGTRYEWADSKDEKGKTIVTLASNKDGQFVIEGLAYGTYKLEEVEAPKGFAKISDIEFTVGKGSLNKAAEGVDVEHIGYENNNDKNLGQRIVNKTVTIPQTGGMGTVLFTVVGIGLMAGAVMAMKKNREEA